MDTTCTDGLRTLADRRGLLLGTAVVPSLFTSSEPYAATIARDFNCLVAENVMKFSLLQPTPGGFDFAAADEVVAFARAHDMRLRGHTFAWHNQIPDWARAAATGRAETETILHDHIDTVACHFRGKVFCWDVVNEAIEDRTYGYRTERHPWQTMIGPEYIDLAFRWAHEADPEALLFYNDYDLEWVDAKFEACYRLVGELLERGVPVHGVGVQYHTRAEDAPRPEAVAEKFRRMNALGLTVHITELDVKVPGNATAADLALQADVYRGILETALGAADCPAVMMWGFTDRHSWIPGFTKGAYDHTLPYDRDYRPKPAWHALREVLARE